MKFDINHCVMTVCNHDTNKCFEFIITPPYAPTQEELHSLEINMHDAYPATASKTKSKRRVNSSLLHRRMGHRSLPVLMNASKNDLLEDTKIIFLKEIFVKDAKSARQ